MSGFWYEPEDPSFFTAAGGEASLGQIYQAARDASLYVDNTFAAQAAMERAYDDRNAKIFDLTGEKLDNPYRMGWQGADQQARDRAAGVWQGPLQSAVSTWQGRVRELAGRRPELASQLMPTRSIEDDALALTRDADERFSTLAGSRSGAGKWIAAFAGGGMGAVRDPVQVGTMMLGGGPGGARTVAGRILTTALSEAAVNAGVELALQPIVQSYRAKAGLEHGVGIAFQNAAFAGLIGGVFGAGARGLGEVLSRGGRSADRALAHAVDDMPPELAAEIRNNLPAATAAVRDSLPLPARGALDQVDMIEHLDATRPATALPEQHDRMVSRAHEASEALRTVDRDVPAFTADQEQISRITDQLLGDRIIPTEDNPRGFKLMKDTSSSAGTSALRYKGEIFVGVDHAEAMHRAINKYGQEAADAIDADPDAHFGRVPRREITNAEYQRRLKQRPSLVKFLQAGGGVLDDQGELAAIGADGLAKKPKGRDQRVPLDRAREAAEEAGYIGRAGETQTTTVADLLNALDQELRGQPVYSRADAGEVARLDHDADRARVESRVAEVAAHAGPAVDDAIVREAAEISLRDGTDAFDALEQVLVRQADEPGHLPVGRAAEPMPGWSDAELEAASASRGNEPNPENGSPFDDPGRPVAELEISPDDVGLFGDIQMAAPDGRVVSLEAYMADIANDAELIATVKACRV